MSINLSYAAGVITMTSGDGDNISPERAISVTQVEANKVFGKDAGGDPVNYRVALTLVQPDSLVQDVPNYFLSYVDPTTLVLNDVACEDSQQFMDWFEDAAASAGGESSGPPYNMTVNNANPDTVDAMELENTASADLDGVESRSSPAIRWAANTLIDGVSTKIYMRIRLVGESSRNDARLVIESCATLDDDPLIWTRCGYVDNSGNCIFTGQGNFNSGLNLTGLAYFNTVNPSVITADSPLVIAANGEIRKRALTFPITTAIYDQTGIVIPPTSVGNSVNIINIPVGPVRKTFRISGFFNSRISDANQFALSFSYTDFAGAATGRIKGNLMNNNTATFTTVFSSSTAAQNIGRYSLVTIALKCEPNTNLIIALIDVTGGGGTLDETIIVEQIS